MGSTSGEDESTATEGERVGLGGDAAARGGEEREEEEGGGRGGGVVDPDSPNSKTDSTSGSSEGVLVEHPVNADQAHEPSAGHRDAGILVNIDGSMQENPEGDDASREDSFVDAPDDLGYVEERSSGGLDESMAMIEIGDQGGEKQLKDEVNRLRGLLAEALDECGRYKGEQDLLGREIGNIQCQLKAMTDRRPPVAHAENLPQGDSDRNGEDSRDFHHSMPLHSVLRDCSKLASLLRVSFDEQLQWEGTTRELRAALDAKDQEIEELDGKLSEFLVSRDVVASYVDSLRESSDAVVKKLSTSLSTVVQDYEVSQDTAVEENTLVEKKTLLLIDRYAWFHYETEQLGQYLYSIGSRFAMPHGVEIFRAFDAARSELLESRTRETYYIEKISELEKEKGEILGKLDGMDVSLKEARSDAGNAKKELEQMEQRFLSAKDKLSIAVNKGKSLVQNRDSLKQLLAERSAELEKRLQELQQKSDALEAAEQSVIQLNQSQDLALSLQSMISEKDNILHAAEKAISQSDLPEELHSRDIIEKIKWLTDQRKISEGILMENNKLQHALSSSGLPVAILSTSLENQINWLGESFSNARKDLSKMQDEIGNVRYAFELCQSELLQSSNEIENLREVIFVEKQQKDSLHLVNEELVQKFESMVENLSRLSTEKNRLMRVLGELSHCTANDEADDDAVFTERCVEKIKEKISVKSELSSDVTEWLQRLQSLLYDRNLELAFCETMLEGEMNILSDDLHRTSVEAESLRNERNSLQKSLEETENRSSFVREKLSMAVKKGKGLVQEREGLKQSLEAKNSEIDKLKYELNLQESKISEYKEQIKVLTTDLGQIEKMESDIAGIRNERDQIELLLQERNSVIQRMIESIEQIGPSSDIIFEGPVQRLKWIRQHVFEVEAGKIHSEKELERLNWEVTLQANKLSDAFVNIRSLEDALSEAKKHISATFEEKEKAEFCKSSVELELRKVRELVDVQTADLEQAYDRVNSLEEALLYEKNRMSLLIDEKHELELKRNQEIMELNTKVDACMEELEGTTGSLKNQSAELNSQFRYILSLTKADRHVSLATEQFRENVNGLKNMARLLESIHDNVSAGWLETHPGLKQVNVLAKLHSLPELEEYINVKEPNLVESIAEADDFFSFTKVAESVTAQSKFLDGHLTNVSCYINDQITLLMIVIEEIRDYILHIQKVGKSCKQNVDELEASNKAQEIEIFSLQNDLSILQSACSDAIQVLPINLHEILDLGHLEQDFMSLDQSEADTESSAKHIKTAENLLHVANIIKNQIKQLSEAKNIWLGSIDDLKNKLQRAESSAESAYQERNIEHERVTSMEAELKTLQNFCSQLKSTVEDYQSTEVAWKDRETELASLQESLVHLNSMVEDYQSRELIWKDREKELASLQNVSSELKSMEEDYQTREVVWKEKVKELAALQSFCSELKSVIEDYQSKEVVWKEMEKELAASQSLCSELKSMIEDYQSKEVLWKEKEEELAPLQSICSELKSTIDDYQSREAVWKNKDMELNSLQGVCSELKSLVEDYQSREVVWKDREKELASLQHKLALKDREGSEKLILEGQLATLFEKVNKMIPFAEVEVHGQEPHFSSAMDKILYLLDSVDALQNMMDKLIDEKKKMQSSLAVHADETKHLKKVAKNLISDQELENRNNDLNELTIRLMRILQEHGGDDSLGDKKPDTKDLLSALERLIMTSFQDSECSKLREQELGVKLLTAEKVINELSAKVRSVEDPRSVSPETKDRGTVESSSSITALEISEVDVVGPHGKSSLSHPPAASLRPMRKISADHIALNIDTETDRLIGANESEDKGHVFKSLNTSGLIPKQGKLIADRVDSIWVSGGRLLMSRPGARIGIIAYWIFLHMWVLATIL